MHVWLVGRLLLDNAIGHGCKLLAIALGRLIALMVVVVTLQAWEVVTCALHLMACAPETHARFTLAKVSKNGGKDTRKSTPKPTAEQTHSPDSTVVLELLPSLDKPLPDNPPSDGACALGSRCRQLIKECQRLNKEKLCVNHGIVHNNGHINDVTHSWCRCNLLDHSDNAACPRDGNDTD